MSDLRKKEIDFVRRYRDEIAPITRNSEALAVIKEATCYADISSKIDLGIIDSILEEFETKIFFLEKSNSCSDSKRILVEANDPGAYGAIKPLISSLEKDDRCSGIIVLTSGVASLYFQNDFSGRFSQFHSGGRSVLGDILNLVEAQPVDIVLATGSAGNSPDSVALLGSKCNLGAKKIFWILDGWTHVISKSLTDNKNSMEEIDGIFCNDELAKEVFQSKYTNIPVERIHSFGTPVLDSLDLDRADENRKNFRGKLGIDDRAIALTYLGDVGVMLNSKFGSRLDICEKTLKDTLEKVIELASENPDKDIVFSFRQHPRNPDRGMKYESITNQVIPRNLSLKDAGPPLSMNEVAYGSDVFLSIVSTENFLAPRRGRRSVFLGFNGVGMGRDLLEKVFGVEVIAALSGDLDGISITDSPEDLKDKISAVLALDAKNSIPIQDRNNAQKILDIILRC